MKVFLNAVRATEWWEHKLAPILGTGYATAFLLGARIWHVAPTLLLTLVALIPGAAYVALINDLTDLDDDSAAGKQLGLAGRSRVVGLLAIAACCSIGLAVAILAWRHDLLAAGLYGGAWLSFFLYSVPPIRLKARGALGVFADAAGAHVLPNLLIAAVVFRWAGRPLEPYWLVVVGIWSAAHGIRSILCHQLDDVAADTRSGSRTFARNHPDAARRAGAFLCFPIELAFFVALLVRANNVLALAMLLSYALLEGLRSRRWGAHIRVVSPASNRRLAMYQYYVVFYPLSFLVAASLRHPQDSLVLLIQLVMFPRGVLDVMRDAKRGARGLLRAALPNRHQPLARQEHRWS